MSDTISWDQQLIPEGKFNPDSREEFVYVYKDYRMRKCQWRKTCDGIVSVCTNDYLPMIGTKIIGTFPLSCRYGTGRALIVKLDDNYSLDVCEIPDPFEIEVIPKRTGLRKIIRE